MLYQPKGCRVYWMRFKVAGKAYRLSTGSRDKRHAAKVLESCRHEARMAACRGRMGLAPQSPLSAGYAAPVSSMPQPVKTPPRANMGLYEALETWKQWADRNITPSGIERVGYAVNSLIAYLGDRRFDRRSMQDWQQSLMDAGRSPKTVNGYVMDIQGLINRLAKMGKWHGDNPAAGIERLRIARKAPVYLDSEQSAALMVAAKDQGWDTEAYCALMLHAGLRDGEALAAMWEWIDWNRRTLTVQAGPDWQPKDKDARVIPLPSALAAILESRRADTGHILLPFSPRYRGLLRKPFEKAAKAAGLDGKCSPHVLRKTFASRLAQAGISGLKIAAWMGHSDPAITSRHYANLGTAWDAGIDA